MDPLAGSPWSSPQTVEGFVKGAPNRTLLDYAERVRPAHHATALDIGCGAGRNLLPLSARGWRVLGTDLSLPMLDAARRRAHETPEPRTHWLALAPMEALPVRSQSIDLVIAHGIWNLATSDQQFRRALAEAARVARPGASLFVFTFSRQTLAPEAAPLPGEALTYTQFSGHPQIFLTEQQLHQELDDAGFDPDPALRLVEHNRPAAAALRVASGGPVIYEGGFRRRSPGA